MCPPCSNRCRGTPILGSKSGRPDDPSGFGPENGRPTTMEGTFWAICKKLSVARPHAGRRRVAAVGGRFWKLSVPLPPSKIWSRVVSGSYHFVQWFAVKKFHFWPFVGNHTSEIPKTAKTAVILKSGPNRRSCPLPALSELVSS